MRAKCVVAIPAVVTLLAVTLLSCLCGCAAKPAPQPASDIVKETDEATARETAEKRKDWDEITEKLRSMCKDIDVKVEPNELPDPMGIFGLGQLKEKAEAAHKSTAEIVVTEQDLWALDAYAAGQFARTEELLNDTAQASGKRPFPLFLRGCALFELKRFAEAAACFDAALSLEKDSRMCCLLAEMSRQIEKTPDATDDDVWTAYDFAYKATLERMPMPKEEGEFPSFASAFTSPITFDPIRVRLEQAAARIRQKRRLGILQDYLKTTDPERKVVLALLMDEKIGRLAILSLSKEHPENKELRVFAFLLRYYGGADDKLSERGPDYAQDFATAQADEPENGFLTLLGITGTDDDYKVPLNSAEIALLTRATHSKEFQMYFSYRAQEVAKENRARGGECFDPWSEAPASPIVMSDVRYVIRRAGATIPALFEDGKEAQAQALLSDVQLLIARVRSQDGGGIPSLAADWMDEQIAWTLDAYAERAKRADLLERIFAMREAAARQEALASAGVTDSLALLELPVPRIREALLSRNRISSFESRALRMLQLYPDRFRQEAFESLRWVSAEGHTNLFDEYKAVVILQMLKDPKALPILEPLGQHADPLLSRLAQKAIADIKSKP